MTYSDFMAKIDPSDRAVVGVYPRGARVRFETLDTQAGLRIRRLAERFKRHGVTVTSGEVNNGSGRYFVRVNGLVDDGTLS